MSDNLKLRNFKIIIQGMEFEPTNFRVKVVRDIHFLQGNSEDVQGFNFHSLPTLIVDLF